jgi:hypothetical protein
MHRAPGSAKLRAPSIAFCPEESMKKQAWSLFTVALVWCSSAGAVAPPDQVARLGKDLTAVGAEKAGNADGSVPAWVGAPAFAPSMLTIKRAELETLRTRLVKDIQNLVGDPAVVGDMLVQAQAIMDAEPTKADAVLAVVKAMLSADASLKADFDKALAGRGGKSVDGLLAQVQARTLKLPQLKDDIVAVIAELKKSGGQAFLSRMVAAFDIGKVLEIVSIVDDPKTRVQANELVMKYMPSYVRGFLEYKVPGSGGVLEIGRAHV